MLNTGPRNTGFKAFHRNHYENNAIPLLHGIGIIYVVFRRTDGRGGGPPARGIGGLPRAPPYSLASAYPTRHWAQRVQHKILLELKGRDIVGRGTCLGEELGLLHGCLGPSWARAVVGMGVSRRRVTRRDPGHDPDPHLRARRPRNPPVTKSSRACEDEGGRTIGPTIPGSETFALRRRNVSVSHVQTLDSEGREEEVEAEEDTKTILKQSYIPANAR
ncbi:hypothetical protein GWK47_053815 [Chionoecetes opilio]|uniref:Uncharacterized protein n=1 Tax=Chionoecetes opilio TaxID=41210 RepID=A0A8J4Y0P2_CHIOP|nr:hypothetical protein GWK47_053815 [Chionoecetes opilio]